MKDERDMVGTLHPQVVAQMRTAQRLCQYTEAELMEELGRRELARNPIPDLPKLDDLAKLYGTDKGPTEHNYTPLYDQHFWLRRCDQLTLLELGIYRGASLRMWRDYFPNATIIGLDRNYPPSGALEGMDVVCIQADQNDANVIDHLGSLYGPLHIVIDDASHISSKTIRSFELLWPHLAPGGIYVIEDLQTSYDPLNYGHTEASCDPDLEPMHLNPPGGIRRKTAMQFCKRLADEVNAGLYPDRYRLGYDIASVEFHLNICFITKAGKWAAT